MSEWQQIQLSKQIRPCRTLETTLHVAGTLHNQETSTTTLQHTPKVGSIRQTGGHLAVRGDDVHDPFLDEVHLRPHGAFLDDVVAGLVHLKA